MGWQIKISGDKYKVWSTIVDEYITDYMTKDELIRFLFWSKFENLMDNILEDMICFPYGWVDSESGKRLLCEKDKHDERFQLLKNRDLKFDEFFKRIKEVGIDININDVDGYNVSTNDK